MSAPVDASVPNDAHPSPESSAPIDGGSRIDSAAEHAARDATTEAGPIDPHYFDSSTIPHGVGCVSLLDGYGIAHRMYLGRPALQTGIVVNGPIGGIRYYANGNIPLITDCRLAVALARVTPMLKDFGVTEMRFSGSYVYRRSKAGFLSSHAYGLAIDVHGFTVDGERLELRKHFRRGMKNGCAADAPVLNRIACEFRKLGLFREFITPDFNRAHHDHFHISIARLKDGSAD